MSSASLASVTEFPTPNMALQAQRLTNRSKALSVILLKAPSSFSDFTAIPPFASLTANSLSLPRTDATFPFFPAPGHPFLYFLSAWALKLLLIEM
jgi:hypothetical protein